MKTTMTNEQVASMLRFLGKGQVMVIRAGGEIAKPSK